MVDLFMLVLISSATLSLGIFFVVMIKKLFRKYFSENFNYQLWLVPICLALIMMIPWTYKIIPTIDYVAQLKNNTIATSKDAQINTTPLKTNVNHVNDEITVNQTEKQQNETLQPATTNTKTAIEKKSLFQHVKSFLTLKTLSMIWGIGCSLFLLFYLIIELIIYRQINRLQRKNQHHDLTVAHNTLNKVKTDLGISKEILIIADDCKKNIFIVGISKPIVVLPIETLGNHNELEMILLHELTHYQQKHILLNRIGLLLRAIHWFNPFVHYMNKQMKADCELACDELVLLKIGEKSKKNYGYTLIKQLSFNSSYMVNSLYMAQHNKAIHRRIAMISKFTNKQRSKLPMVLVIFMLISAMILTVACGKSATETNKNNKSTKKQEQTIVKEVIPYPTTIIGFHLGQTVEEVLAELQKKNMETIKTSGAEADGKYYLSSSTSDFFYQTNDFQFRFNAEKKLSEILVKSKNYSTPHNIKKGDKMSKIIQIYGSAFTKQETDTSSFLTYFDGATYLSFEFATIDQEKLTNWSIRNFNVQNTEQPKEEQVTTEQEEEGNSQTTEQQTTPDTSIAKINYREALLAMKENNPKKFLGISFNDPLNKNLVKNSGEEGAERGGAIDYTFKNGQHPNFSLVYYENKFIAVEVLEGDFFGIQIDKDKFNKIAEVLGTDEEPSINEMGEGYLYVYNFGDSMLFVNITSPENPVITRIFYKYNAN